MALINRVTRMFRSDLHAVLDRIEEPGILLKQALREMQACVDEETQRIKLLNHEHGQTVARQTDIEQSLNQIEDELDVCFGSGKEQLVRGLIKKKLEAQRLLKMLERKQRTLEKELDEFKARLEENRSRLTAMQQKAEIFAEQQGPAQGDDLHADYYADYGASCGSPISSEDVEVAFLREQQKRASS